MLPIFLAVLVWLPATIGLGDPVLRLHGEIDAMRPLKRLGLAGICGLMVISLIGISINFFAAVTQAISASVLAIGWLLCILQRRQLFDGNQRLHIISASILIAIVSLSAARGIVEYDTGLYHLAAVKWITNAPLPLGLANLYGRLGFNSAWFAAAAVLEGPYLLAKSTFLLNPLFLVLFGLILLDAIEAVWFHGLDRANPFLLLTAYPWAAYGFMFSSSLYPDLPVMLLTCLVTSLWLDKGNATNESPLAVTLSVFAITLKLSAIPLLIGALLILLIRRGGAKPILVGLWTATLALWIARGIALSGCILYPSAVTRLANFRWTVPEARVRIEAACIGDWARYRQLPWQVPTDGRWMEAWLIRNFATPPIPLALAVLVLGVILFFLRSDRGSVRAQIKSVSCPMLACSAGIVFWFFTAPDVRFGYGYLFSFAALFCCLGFQGIRASAKRSRLKRISAGAAALLLLVVTGYFQHWGRISWVSWPAIPSIAFDEESVTQGQQVFVPTSGDQVWLVPLPATPYPDPALRYEMNDRGQFRRFWLDSAESPMLVP